MNFPLFDSILLGFKNPNWDEKTVFCTPQTLFDIREVSVLSECLSPFQFTCTPNIWSSKFNRKTDPVCVPIRYPLFPSLFSSREATPVASPNSSPLTPCSSMENSPVEITAQLAKPMLFPSLNGRFDVPQNSKFFVIKSYSELDVQASLENEIWTSTELGNRRLDNAYAETKNIFLFFLVNGSAKFCGVARMEDKIDFTKTSNIWVEHSRWKGIFPVRWLIVKEIPNRWFRMLRVPLNEDKPVTNSRDTQELPFDVGVSMLKLFTSFQ